MSQATTREVQAREMPCSNLPVCGGAAAGVGRPWGMRCWLLQQGWGCCMWCAACGRWTVCLWCWCCLRCPCIRALRLIHFHLQTITRPSSIHLTMGQTHRNQVNNKAIKHLSYNGTNTQEPSQTITRPSSIRLTMGQTHRNQVNNKAIKHPSYNGTHTQEPSQ